MHNIISSLQRGKKIMNESSKVTEKEEWHSNDSSFHLHFEAVNGDL